jgi:DNA polymerase
MKRARAGEKLRLVPTPEAHTTDPAGWRDAVQESAVTLAQVEHAAEGCRACDLWKRATQTVFGRGPARTRVMLVGEQPGDREDRVGEPFVGPAGQLLDRALAEAGIDRSTVYVTNVVKHFSWEERGKWRIHKKPKPHQIEACRPWFDAEIAALKPEVLVCLGATAAQALLGRAFRVTQQRGELIPSPLAPRVLATVHPSSLLRAPDDETRAREMERFIADLRRVAQLMK